MPPGPPGGAQETIDAKIPTVTLQIIEPQDLPPEQKSYITFDTQGGTIGLSTDNDWVLADNEHYISGEHATIQYREDGYYIVDRSSNGTSLKSLGQAEAEEFRDEERKLNDGDLLYIDKYGIEVTLEERNEDSIPKPIPKPTGEPPTASTKTRTPTTNTQKDPDEQEKLLSSKRSGDDQDAIAAFLKGAGLTNISIDQLDPDLMRTLGQAFREMMEGIIKLIEARKAFKIGANIEGTRFRAGANNPLKNNRDPSMVLEIMLLKRQGYIPMLDSLQEAFEDIEAHLIGMGSGILTSLENTLERLSPREIEMLVEQEHKKKWFNADSQKWKTVPSGYDLVGTRDCK
ncbi:type VI secretion system fha domain protein [Candidatus Thiomargarita nelsonii]|uniref:Type VI secretion system fha domain protein n=1 Tax=Candidatus Thiomargarita nelsonii TaxID=1003181 RepID=A0A176S3N9_9GAMM|nr:type VI secretion system fha domain protein [Candidatus Thiomargarita nelsonii]